MRRPVVELLEELRSLDEHERIEAKRGFGKEALHTIASFSNEPGMRGGYLLFGLSEDVAAPGGFRVVGIADPERLSSDLATQCRQGKFNQPIRPEIWTEEAEGGCLVAAFIPEATPANKPVFLEALGLPRGAFRRVGSTDQHGTEEDLERYRDLASNRPFEDGIVADATMEDLDSDVLAAYRRELLEANPATELRGYALPELVAALGGSRLADDGVMRPTVAGVLLFGSRLSLRRLFPMVRVDYIRVDGTEWVPGGESRFENALEIRDPLMVAFRRIYQAIVDDLPRSFGLDGSDPQRKEETTIPARVVREAVVNALVHRSYRIHQPVQVIRYRNRLEIRNPGHSLVDEELLGKPGSISRNPRIADVFREMRLAENKGTGIAVMRREMAAARLSPPTFESDRGRERFVATLFLHHLLSDVDRSWLARFNSYNLDDQEALALILAREKGEVRNSSLRDLTGLDTLAASQRLRHLRDMGLIEMRGSGSAAHYVLVEVPELPETDSARGEPLIAASIDLPAALHTNTAIKTEGLTVETGGLALGNGGVLLRYGGDDGQEDSEESADPALLPPVLQGAIESLGKRPRSAHLHAVIERLCAIRPMTPGQLAGLLGRRNVGHLVEKHLGPMVRDGRLERTFPDIPAHPRQAYRTVERAPEATNE